MAEASKTPRFDNNLISLKPADHVKEIVLFNEGKEVYRIPRETSAKSIRVVSNVLEFEDGMIGLDEMKKALDLFAEHTPDAVSNPGKHKTIDPFLRAFETGSNSFRAVINFNIPEGLEQAVLELDGMKKAGKLFEKRVHALGVFGEVVDLLEKGRLRSAQYSESGWKVNEWVKKGFMLGFPLGANIVYGSGDITFVDKETLPLRKINPDTGIRVVPPAAGLRRGSYAGRGAVFMSPGAYVNIAGFVGRGTMVEGLVGSCAQVGKNCHISIGANIGGVLEPIEASPVILGDYVLLGEGSGVTQGTRLGDLVTLAPGTHISKGTPVVDIVKGKIYASDGVYQTNEQKVCDHLNGLRYFMRGKKIEEKDKSFGPEIPRGALVVPRASLRSSTGELVVVPTIVKYINNPSERSYELEKTLRGE